MRRFDHKRCSIRIPLRSIIILALQREKGSEHMDTPSNIDLTSQSVTLKAVGIGDDGQPIALGGKKPVWTFEPADLVQVDLSADWTEAVLSRKSPGTVTVTVAVDAIRSAPVTVQVHGPQLAGLAIQVAAAAQGSAAPAAAA